MRIGVLSPSVYMSPSKYGDMIFAPRILACQLVDGLVDRGHTVYFFTAPDISTKAKLVGGDWDLLSKKLAFDKLRSESSERQLWAAFYRQKEMYEHDLTTRCFAMAAKGELDIIHSYHDWAAHFYEDVVTAVPTIYTLHDPLPTNPESMEYWLFQRFAKHRYVSISTAFQIPSELNLRFIDTVYHGVRLPEETSYVQSPEPYMVCMGRMVPEKGIDVAIQVAKETQLYLRIATNVSKENKSNTYFSASISPLLQEYSKATLVGHLQGREKDTLLSQATAFLFPIQWEEPFGMVMIEAMACGTPVIAYNRGSVAEIVKDGVTGFIIDSEEGERKGTGSWVIKKRGIEGFIEAVRRIREIDRAACRKHVEDHFSLAKMVEGYERVYEKVVKAKR